MSNNNGNDKRENIADNLKYFFHSVTGTLDYTDKFKEQDRVDNRMMAMLSYVIPLIPFIAERHSTYVKFHSNQGMNLWVWFIIVKVFLGILGKAFAYWNKVVEIIEFFGLITNILLVALAAYGVVYTLKGCAKEVPIVSKLNLITIVSSLFGK